MCKIINSHILDKPPDDSHWFRPLWLILKKKRNTVNVSGFYKLKYKLNIDRRDGGKKKTDTVTLLVFQTARVDQTIMCRGRRPSSQRKVRFTAQTGRLPLHIEERARRVSLSLTVRMNTYRQAVNTDFLSLPGRCDVCNKNLPIQPGALLLSVGIQ